VPDRVDDPYGLAFGAPRPESGFAPVVRPVTRDTHTPGWVGPLAHSLKNTFVFGVPNHPERPDDTRALVDLATMFLPGPKGVKAVGPLTPGQKVLLERLNNVQGGGKPRPRPDLTPDELDLFHEIYGPGGYNEHVRRPYRFTPTQTSIAPSMHPSQGDIHDFAGVFGIPRGQPFFAQQYEQGLGRNPGRLGRDEGGTVPSWVTTASERRIWEAYRHNPSSLAALAGMKDDVRAALAQIIDTINRRGASSGGLPDYGGN
jgi:hypothetical protein